MTRACKTRAKTTAYCGLVCYVAGLLGGMWEHPFVVILVRRGRI